MAQSIILCCLLFTIFGCHQVTSVPKYTIDEAIEDINFFIPGSKLVLTSALKLWSLYGEVKHLVDPNSTQILNKLDNIDSTLLSVNDQLNGISDHLDDLSDDVRDVKDLINDKVLNQLPKEISLDNKLSAIYDDLDKVDALFKRFSLYNNATKKHARDTLLNFANNVVDHGLNELPSVLQHIHRILVNKKAGINILTVLADKRFSDSMMCVRGESGSHAINFLYNNIMKIEIKGLLMTEFAYSIKEAFNNDTSNYDTEIIEARNEFDQRTAKTVMEVKKAMARAPRDFWMCDPQVHRENVTYSKLGPVFQAYLTKESDAKYAGNTEKWQNKCSDTCEERSDASDRCRSKFCRKHGRRCLGTLRNCKSVASTLKICLTDSNKSRRFEYVEFGEKGEVYGYKKTCGKNNEVNLNDRLHIFSKCEYCMCTCEDTKTVEIDRYFSLRNVVADVHDNKIVTGVKLVKKNQIFHIQIEQGLLVPNGNVNESTLEWKRVDNFTVLDNTADGKDYYSVSWNQRTIHLDNLDSPTHHVLTGLRFKKENHYLKLEIQVTPFDFTTGKLKVYGSKWISKPGNHEDRIPLNINDHDLATNVVLNVPDTSENQYVNFTISSLKKDAGQTTVPFIDLQPIKPTPSVPLSGVGFFHRGNEGSAGFLGFKLYTYNYAPHLRN